MRGRGRGAEVDELRRDDPARLAIDRDRELQRAQVGDRLALVVDHADVDLEKLDAGAKHRKLLRLYGCRQTDQENRDAVPTDQVVHESPPHHPAPRPPDIRAGLKGSFVL